MGFGNGGYSDLGPDSETLTTVVTRPNALPVALTTICLEVRKIRAERFGVILERRDVRNRSISNSVWRLFKEERTDEASIRHHGNGFGDDRLR